MKKIISVFLALISAVGITTGLAACDGGNKGDKDKTDGTTGGFYTLSEAYESGYLTQADLINIAYYQNNEIAYTPGLENSQSDAIKQCAAKYLRERKNNSIPEAKANGFDIIRYLGDYSENYVALIRNDYELHPTDVPENYKEIGGVEFRFVGYETIWVCKLN